MRKTDTGRTVFGGDGITPDERFSYPAQSGYETDLTNNLVMFFFGAEYFGDHSAKLDRDWKPDDAFLNQFRTYAAARGVATGDTEFDSDRGWLKEHLREEMFVTAFSKEQAERVGLENDPEIERAINALPSSKALLARPRQTVAERTHHEPALVE